MFAGEDGLREATIRFGDSELKVAIVQGLANAGKVADRVVAGECPYDLVEVMACPGGCIGGAGQPVAKNFAVKRKRMKGILRDRSPVAVAQSPG